MFCPSCGAETHRFMTMEIKGVQRYACPGCEKKAPKALKKAVAKKRGTSPKSRKFEKFALSKAEIKSTQARKPTVKAPDTPAIREAVNVTPSKPRTTVYEMGSTTKSNRNARVMNKLINKLGQNPKIISDNGFKVVAESTTF